MSEIPVSVTPTAPGAPTEGAERPPVVLNYGSAPGELSACIRSVGIVDRTDLERIRAEGPPAAIDAMVARLTGARLAVGGGVRLAEAWWCRPTDDAMSILCSRDSLPRLHRLLRETAARHRGVTTETDVPYSCIGIVGLRTPEVLRAVGVYGAHGDPRRVPPCTVTTTAGVDILWVLESDVCAIACLRREHLPAARSAIEELARPFGMARIGREAFDNYTMLERRRRARMVVS